ncbi:MAG: hypothetical protein MZV70_54520 [Desulfobacterales bacterium]|nr:hypothetical protein [Desulfobacterales bacterium]
MGEPHQRLALTRLFIFWIELGNIVVSERPWPVAGHAFVDEGADGANHMDRSQPSKGVAALSTPASAPGSLLLIG